MEIRNGDVLTLYGEKSDDAYAKVDYIDFEFISEIPIIYPEFTIDYTNERIAEQVTDSFEYSYNQTAWTTGPNDYLALTPGQDVYIRYIHQPEGLQFLDIPDRPATPTFAIDFSAETTSESVSSAYEYSTASNMSGAISGAGSAVVLTPGQNMYFRVKATASNFKSAIQSLTVPARPVAPPAFDINFPTESTSSAVPSTIEYSTSSDMSSPVNGNNAVIALTPGQDLYLRYKATVSAFCSSAILLDVPDRPDGPVFTIDFVNETTNETLGASIQYSNTENMESPASGDGSVLDLEPATDYYFRKLPTATEFRSAVSHLETPSRPEFLTDYDYDTTSSTVIPIQLTYETEIAGFELSDLQLTNCTAGNLGGDNYFEVYPADYGFIYVALPANTLEGDNFAAEIYSIQYVHKNPDALGESEELGQFEIYPSPVADILTIRSADMSHNKNIVIYNTLGEKIYSSSMDSDHHRVNVSEYKSGLYIILIKDLTSGKTFMSDRFFKE